MTATCALRVDPMTLTAYDAGLLAPLETQTLRDHIAECAACQHILAEDARVAGIIRALPVPPSGQPLWRAVQRATQRQPRVLLVTRRGLGIGGSIVTAALLVLAIIWGVSGPRGGHLSQPTTSISPQQTAVGVATVQVLGSIWLGITLPPGLTTLMPPQGLSPLEIGYYNFEVAPSDGTTAYACFVAAPNTVQVWVTHDRALNWRQTATIAVDHAFFCTPQIDSGNADSLNIFIQRQATVASANLNPGQPPHSPLAGPNFLPTVEQFSLDGGITWHAEPAGVAVGRTTATVVTGPIFALVALPGESMTHLSVSTDHMATWQPIDAPLRAANQLPLDYWTIPGRGTLYVLAETLPTPSSTVRSPATLWISDDSGGTWRQAPLDIFVSTHGFFGVTPTIPARFCAEGSVPSTQAIRLECTTDDGAQWSQMPLPHIPYIDPTSPQPGHIAYDDAVLGMATDGLLLAYAPAPANQNTLKAIYTLPVGATAWREELLGSPNDFGIYVGQPGHGVFWDIAEHQPMRTSTSPNGYTSIVP